MDSLREFVPERSPEEIIRGVVRLELGGVLYTLREPVIEETDAWLEKADEELTAILGGLDAAGDDIGKIMGQLTSAGSPKMLELLASYDVEHVLPPAEDLRKTARPAELIRAVMGVWLAANPLVAIALGGMVDMMRTAGSGALSLLQPLTAGPLDGSAPNSPTDSSSATSTPPPNGSTRTGRTRSARSRSGQ